MALWFNWMNTGFVILRCEIMTRRSLQFKIMIDISDCKCIADVCRKYIGNVTTSNKNKTKKLLEAEGID